MDSYALGVGIRSVAARGDRLLLNGEPIKLTGFGMHEDFPAHGRGLDLPVWVRNFELLKWAGVNSLRSGSSARTQLRNRFPGATLTATFTRNAPR